MPDHARQRRRRRSAVAMAAAVLLAAGAAVAVTQFASAATDPGSIVKVNQVAYVPGAAKQATVVSSSGSPIAWTLKNSAGATVASGQTVVKGADALSGDNVHIVDFSSYDVVGKSYVLSAGGANSYPFDISADSVKKLRYDSLAFFYHQRSGTPIDAQYVGSQYARPAGHANVAPNQGDNNVPCRVDCGYTTNLLGGWYDAGDQGKYVVNGGISSWQLQNEYERAVRTTGADAASLGDGKLAIPERSNGIPDVLDEARWEVEFLLKMQIPDGRTDAGMARLKISDENWTALPMRPQDDPQRRVVSAPTTTATLNLAAVAAQSARIWQSFDATFAAKCLAAARKAYAAAKANPNRLADANDTNGSGTYTDSTTNDEFYWAAAELYATTGESAYRTDVMNSPQYKGASFNSQGLDWWWTGGLGDATLAIVPNGLPSGDVAAIRQALISFADGRLSAMNGQGYPAPVSSYNWGSDGNIANNGIILALAYDFTGQAKYRNGVYQTLDYLMGRNPLNRSYIAGYGENPVQNVHHRFWAHSLNNALPIAPPGSLAGGANSGLEDPTAKAQLAGCKPQKCHIDDIQAYSVNEVALNWNSSLAWLSNWAAEKAGTGSTQPPPSSPPVTTPPVTTPPATTPPATTPPVTTPPGTTPPATTPASNGTCRATYKVVNAWSGGFQGEVTVTNPAAAATNGWMVSWTFPNGQVISSAWGGVKAQTGANVSVRNEAWNGTLAPGAATTVGFIASSTGTNGVPTNVACASG